MFTRLWGGIGLLCAHKESRKCVVPTYAKVVCGRLYVKICICMKYVRHVGGKKLLENFVLNKQDDTLALTCELDH